MFPHSFIAAKTIYTPIMTCAVWVLGGNVGCGKTTACAKVATALDACYVPEPVEEWRESGMLKKFYSNPVENGFEFQTYAMRTRISALNARLSQWRHSHDGKQPETLILDRWLDDDMMFAKVTKDNGNMTPAQFDEYCAEHARVKRSTSRGMLKNPRTIWLTASPQTCLKRLNARGREEEHGITIEYLQALDAARPDTLFSVDTDASSAEDVATKLISIIRPNAQ